MAERYLFISPVLHVPVCVEHPGQHGIGVLHIAEHGHFSRQNFDSNVYDMLLGHASGEEENVTYCSQFSRHFLGSVLCSNPIDDIKCLMGIPCRRFLIKRAEKA